MTTRRAFGSVMMLTVMSFVVSSFTASFAFAQKKTSKEKSSSTKTSSPKMTTTTAPTRPQYLMTVTSGGKALGNVTIEIFNDLAPKHAANFDSLVATKFYDGTAFHRVIPGFMIQGGDPNSRPNSGKPKMFWGTGEPGLRTVPAEFSQTLRHEPGIISAARGPDTNSATTQFFICHGVAPHLDGQYSIYGRVVSGMEVVDQIARVACEPGGDGQISSPIEKVEMTIVKKK